MLKNKVAVITGAASGIGKGIAQYCAAQKMRLVLADIEVHPLLDLLEDLRSSSACDAIAVPTDVSKDNALRHLAEQAFSHFGTVDFLFNNAGVGVGGAAWQVSLAHWDWAIDVNLKSVIYGINAFVPKMLKQKEVSYVVNTASIIGIGSGVGMAPYIVTKNAVVSLSETLHHDLRGSNIKVSVFCPTIVKSRIMDSFRNAPESVLAMERTNNRIPEAHEVEFEQTMRTMFEEGMSPILAAERLFSGILAGDFYIFNEPALKNRAKPRDSSLVIASEQN